MPGRKKRLELRSGERQALEEIKRRLKGAYPVERLIVYGSVARGEASEGSDLDLLVVASRPVSHREQYAMVDEVCEVNLEYGSNISILIVDGDNWERGFLSAMPLRAEVERDGVSI